MKSALSKEIESALIAITTSTRPPGVAVNICYEGDMEEFFRIEREGVCRYFLKNECKKGENCEFKHSDDQIKTKYKTKLCKNFLESSFCKYKDQCSYAHGEKELKMAAPHLSSKRRNSSEEGDN